MKTNAEIQNPEETLLVCPICGSSKKVVEISKIAHTAANLFLFKPLDTHFCKKCRKGFRS